MADATRVLVMGVSGAGKSTFGAALAARLGAGFVDADDLHPQANRDKLAAGIELTDADRLPWLGKVATALAQAPVVVACSALRFAYRERMRQQVSGIRLIYLYGSRAILAARVAGRVHAFMPGSLLDSQLATLEPPTDEEAPIRLDIAHPVSELVTSALTALAGA